MSVRHALVLAALFTSPAVAPAGPIAFGYGTGNLAIEPGAPELDQTLRPFQPPGPRFTFDPAAGAPVTLPAVTATPALLPPPAPRDTHPDGSAHWNNEGYFGVDVSLLDVASGERATLRFGGRAHTYDAYTAAGGWAGVTFFWFQD